MRRAFFILKPKKGIANYPFFIKITLLLAIAEQTKQSQE